MDGEVTHSQVTALWTASFFDELVRCGACAPRW